MTQNTTPTLDDRLDEILLNFAESINRHPDFNWELRTIPNAKTAIKQALYTALVEQMPEKRYYPKRFKHLNPEPPIGTQHCGFNLALDQVHAVLSSVLGKEKEYGDSK